MSEKAYDICYYESMQIKIRYLFKLIARNTTEPFQTIEAYMRCEYRRNMDRGNPLFLNKTPKQILGSLGIEVSMEPEISEAYDEYILEWMADVYTYLQWNDNILSEKIVEKIKPQELYEKYYPLHETSLTNCTEKLKVIYRLEK